jgi:tetratricopeptide (TPR) repeat protein
LTEAVRAALSSHADALAVEAWARRAYAAGTTTKTDRSAFASEIDVVEGLAQRTTSARFALALLYNNLGTAELADGKRSEARDYFARALTVSQRLGPSMPLELVVTRINLALTVDDRVRSDELLDAAIAELTDRLGAEHPDTLRVRQMQGVMTPHLRQAIDRLTPICQAQLDAARVDRATACWTEIGMLALERGDHEQAIHALQDALHASGEPAEASAYLVWLRGDAGAAARQFVRALAAQPAAPGDHWWDHLARARLRLGLGRTRRATGDVQGARRALEAAIQELEPIVRDHPTADYERRLGRARVELALTWSPTDALSPEQRRVRAAAATWLESIAGSPAEIAELRRGARDR